MSGAAEVEDHPGYTMTRETITMTNQGRLMAINYGGWSANPDPEEEEVSIFYSLSSDTDKCRVSGGRVKNVTCINGNTRWSNVGTFPWLGQTLQTGTDACLVG